MAALVAAFVQISLGGVVRVTGSGLGCPDWPLCHGRIIPPFDLATLIEYTHRLSGSLLGLLSIVTAAIALLRYRGHRWIAVPSVVALLLVVVAGVLGGAAVLAELAWWVVLVHLGIAEGVVAALMVVCVAGWRARGTVARGGQAVGPGLRRLIVVGLLGTFLVVMTGSYVVGSGSTAACPTWPLCRGDVFPTGASSMAVHMGHRYVAALGGAVILWMAWSAWRQARASSLAWASVVTVALFALQVLVGAMVVWGGFRTEAKAFHLSVATLVWAAAVLTAALAYVPAGVGDRQAWSRALVASSEGVAS